jgi:hypothetical protein
MKQPGALPWPWAHRAALRYATLRAGVLLIRAAEACRDCGDGRLNRDANWVARLAATAREARHVANVFIGNELLINL